MIGGNLDLIPLELGVFVDATSNVGDIYIWRPASAEANTSSKMCGT